MSSGALVCLNGQGLQLTSLPPRYVGGPRRDSYIKRLMRCPEAARPNWTAWERLERSIREIAALSVTEKAPEQSGKPTRVLSAQAGCIPRMGTRCWSGRRPGGSGLAKTDQGSQAYLSLAAKLRGR